MASTCVPLTKRRLRGVCCDMDGTLTCTGAIDFAAMRRRCAVPPGSDILAHVHSQPEPLRAEYEAILIEEEEAGLARMVLREDCKEFIDGLKARSLHRALLTRNNEAAMHRTTVLLEDAEAFNIMLSRSFEPVKPHPAALHHICERWNCHPGEVLMIGDAHDDVQCALAAGSVAVLIGEPGDATYERARPHAHYTVRSLVQLLNLIDALNGDADEAAGGGAASAAGVLALDPPSVERATVASGIGIAAEPPSS